MSGQVSSERQPLLPPSQDHRQFSRCCKLSYKPRKFSSKGAVLVLVWQLLSVAAFLRTPIHYSIFRTNLRISLYVLEAITLLVVCIAAGWLADVFFGRMKVVKAGLLLMWLGELILIVCSIVVSAFPAETATVAVILGFLGTLCNNIGALSFFINILQFGLEQIPDSSSVGITAFISWFTIATLFGIWMHELYNILLIYCTSILFYSPIPLCISFAHLSVALCSVFLLSHWLIDHRQSHNLLKTVYQVMKFAKQHKFPVQRSAFTYWEEEIPSRIDLGKAKYGGPFTTEEVEDVKTLFRLLAVLAAVFNFIMVVFEFLLFFPIAFELLLLYPVVLDSSCIVHIVYSSCLGMPVVLCLLYELLLYPVMRCQVSMLRRIGCCVFCMVVSILVLLALTLVSTLGPVDITGYFRDHNWIPVCFVIVALVFEYVLLTSILEFIYSQSPEHVKGFLIGTFMCVAVVIVLVFTRIQDSVINSQSSLKYFGTYLAVALTVHSLVAFIVYCCVARWYKRRERDEPCNQRAIIEEIYSRNVEHNSIEEIDTT